MGNSTSETTNRLHFLRLTFLLVVKHSFREIGEHRYKPHRHRPNVSQFGNRQQRV